MRAAALRAIHVPQRTYACCESGQRMVPPSVLCALADCCGVSVDYILGRTDRRQTNPESAHAIRFDTEQSVLKKSFARREKVL